MRAAYNLLTYLLLLPWALYWALRGLVDRSYWHKLKERFGFGYRELERSIWVHAVSVGEVVTAVPLIRTLLSDYPERTILVTTVTPTGAERVGTIFGETVQHAYIPFETPDAIARFFAANRPELAMIMETEIWPNLYHGCGVRQIPLVLISARISPKSVRSYRRLLPLFRDTLSHGIVIAAQTQADAGRFLSLGAAKERTRVTGNIKFDIDLPKTVAAEGRALREALFPNRPVWVAGSTHDGEESIVLDAHAAVRKQHPDALLILVPRHPQRFTAVRALVERRGFEVVTRTAETPVAPGVPVFLGDTMGELLLCYAAADAAFVGGSLVPVGGHNLLEPAAVGVPMISGPQVFNAEEIAHLFLSSEACLSVDSAAALAAAVLRILNDEALSARMIREARACLADNRGALDRLLAMIRPLLDS